MPELRRASEAFDVAMDLPPGTLTDDDIELRCPRCDDSMTAGEALVSVKGAKTVYECRRHHRPLITIGPRTLEVHEEEGMAIHVRATHEQAIERWRNRDV